MSLGNGTTIKYHLAKQAYVKLVIYDLLGREVKTLVSGDRPAGKHKASWNAQDNQGRQVGAGLYFYRIQAGDFIEIRKLVILK